MPLPRVTIECRAVDDPELRFTPNGAAVAKIRTVCSDRVLDKTTNEWKDGDKLWMNVTVWKQQAENVAESVRKGDLLLISGRLRTEEWEKDGQKHSVISMTADSVAASMQFRVLPHGEKEVKRDTAPANDDPWGAPSSEEPPF